LDELIDYFKNNCDNESIYVEGMDFNAASGALGADPVDLDFASSLLEIFTLNQTSLKYKMVSINLKEQCKQRNSTIASSAKPLIQSQFNNNKPNLELSSHLVNKHIENLTIHTHISSNYSTNASLTNYTFPFKNQSNETNTSWEKISLNKTGKKDPHVVPSDIQIEYKKKFFFKQDNSVNDFNSMSNDYDSPSSIYWKKHENKMMNPSEKKISFIEDIVVKKVLEKVVAKKVDRKFIDHLTGLHRLHI
jgi:hypothetical protein